MRFELQLTSITKGMDGMTWMGFTGLWRGGILHELMNNNRRTFT